MTGLTDAEADFRPDPNRFTLREAVAHLADWEPIFMGRFERTVNEDKPLIKGIDEGELAIKNDYPNTDFRIQLDRFEKGRGEIIAFLEPLPIETWSRMAEREEIGSVTLEDLVGLLPLHDLYHVRQAIEWREKFKAT
jgi:hypothetical protein